MGFSPDFKELFVAAGDGEEYLREGDTLLVTMEAMERAGIEFNPLATLGNLGSSRDGVGDRPQDAKLGVKQTFPAMIWKKCPDGS